MVEVGADQLVAKVDGGTLTARVEHTGEESWHTAFRLELTDPLPCTLHVTQKAEHSRWELWLDPDVKLGDEDFDDRFVVRGEPEEEVVRVLDAAARQALTELSEAVNSVVVDRKGVAAVVDDVVDDTDWLHRLLDAHAHVAGALSKRRSKARSAYR